jgi:chromosome segregation ATPase
MKSNAVAIILIIACLGLGFVLWEQSQKHADQVTKLDESINSYSNHVSNLEDKLSQQVLVNSTLETNLASTKLKASNDLAAIEATLSTTSANLEKSQSEVKAAAVAAAAAQAAMEEKDKKIATLENQNTELDKESSDLRGSITNLEAQIQATQKKYDAAEGDKKLLMAELTHLRAQKEELEKKLSDLAYLKETVRKMKEQLSIDRRLDWIRRGIYDAFGQKGGERLIHPILPGPPATNGSLNVELQQGGGARIVPPSTNAPSTNGPAPQ